MKFLELIDAAREVHVGAVAWTALIAVTGLGGIVFGFWPSIHPGFARADAVAAVATQVSHVSVDLKQILANTIEENIRSKLKVRCNTHDAQFRGALSDEVNEMEKHYFALTGEGFRQPTCDELQ